MDGYHIALFIHLCALVAGAWAASRTHLAESRAHHAANSREALEWYAIAGRAARIFPVVVVLLLVTGGFMMLRGGLTWHDGWVDTGMFAAFLLAAVGGVLGARGRAGARALAQRDGDGPPPAPDYVSARLSRMNTGIALATVLVMTTKPSLIVSFAWLVVGATMGVVSLRPEASGAPAGASTEAAGA